MNKISINNQPILEKIINNINSNSINAQAYLLIGDQKSELNNYSMLLAKVLICPESYLDSCEKCNICKRINDGNFPELRIIEPINGTIKKEVIINLKNSFQVSSIEGKNQIYIIKDAESLNKAAANSILKFLEEPDSNTIAIFLSTNLNLVMNTIASRCQIIKINNIKKDENIDTVCKMIGLEEELVEIIVNLFVKIETRTIDILKDVEGLILNTFNSKKLMQGFLNILLLIYSDMLNYKFLGYFKYFKNNDGIMKISKNIDEKKIIKKISFILNNIRKLDYNVNMLLFTNNLLIGME